MPTFSFERLETPTGPMLIVTDDEDRLRMLDWEDHDERMKRLLQRHYGADAIQLRERKNPSPARRALQAYFTGDINAPTGLAIALNGTDFQRSVWEALRRIPAGPPSATASWRTGSVAPQRRAPWGSPMAPIPSPSSCLAIA